jgi:hypothetical protein
MSTPMLALLLDTGMLGPVKVPPGIVTPAEAGAHRR